MYCYDINKKYHANITFSIPEISYENHHIVLVNGEIDLNDDFLSIKNLDLNLSDKEHCKLRGSLDFNKETTSINFDIALKKDRVLSLSQNSKLSKFCKELKFSENDIIELSGTLYKKTFDDNNVLGNVSIKIPALKYNDAQINDVIMTFTINGKMISCKTFKINFPEKGYCEFQGLIDFEHEIFRTNFELSIHPNIISDILPKKIRAKFNEKCQFREKLNVYAKGFFETDDITFNNYNLEFLLSHPCLQTGDLILYDLLTTIQINPNVITAMFSQTKGTWEGIDFTQADSVLIYKDNKLVLKDLTAKIYEGHLFLNFENDFKTDKRTLKINANEIK